MTLMQRLEAKRLRTAEMVYRLGAAGICVDEGDECTLPIVEYSPDDSRKLLRLLADSGQVRQEDLDAIRKIADGMPVGDAYRMESNPIRYLLRKDVTARDISTEDFMELFYADVAQLVAEGRSQKAARRLWFEGAASRDTQHTPCAEAAEKSQGQQNYLRAKAKFAQRVRRYEQRQQSKKLHKSPPV